MKLRNKYKMEDLTQKNCTFLEILKRMDITPKPLKVNKNTLYSIIDRRNKTLINKTFEECFDINNQNYIIRKLVSIDLEGNLIFEGDYIWYEDPSIGESLAEITTDGATNIEHAYTYEESSVWKNCIVIGNIFKGICIDDYVLNKYCINKDIFSRYKSYANNNLASY